MAAVLALATAAVLPDARDRAQAAIDKRVRIQLSEAVGRSIEFDSLRVTARGASIANLRTSVRPGEPRAPVRIRRIDLSVDWWSLLAGNHLHVSKAVVDGAEITINASTVVPGSPSGTYGAALRDIARSGIRQVELRNGILHFAPTNPTGPEISAAPISAELLFDPRGGFAYHIAVARIHPLTPQANTVSMLDLRGTASNDRVVLSRGIAEWLGGSWRGNGSWNPDDRNSTLHVEVQGLPLADATTQLGATAGLFAGGRIDGVATVELAGPLLHRAFGSVHASAGNVRLATGPMGWQSLAGGFDWSATDARLRLSGLRIVGDGLGLTVDASVVTEPRGDSRAGEFEANGRASGDRSGIADLARRLRIPAQIHEAPWHVGGALVDFRVHGDAARLAAATATGHVHADDLVVRPLPGATSLRVARFDADFDRTSQRLAFRRVRTEAAGIGLEADVTLAQGRGGALERVTASGTATARDFRQLGAAIPELQIGHVVVPLSGAGARATFRASASLDNPEDVQITGALEASRIRVDIPSPPQSPVPPGGLGISVTQANADFHYDARGQAQGRDVFAINNLRGHGASGSFTGTAELQGARRFGLHLSADNVDIDLVRWLVPGTITGGRLKGTLHLAGGDGVPMRSLEGRFELSNAGYVIPPELQWSAEPFAVSTFSGDYRWDNGHTVLRNLALRSDRISGNGEITNQGIITNVRASLATANMGRVVTTWPMLTGLIRDGSATAHLTARIDATGARGRVVLNGIGGTLVLPGVDAAMARQPITHSGLTLDFSPERVTFRDAVLRGPKLNVVASGQWGNGSRDPVHARGRFWLTRQYTSELLTGFRWLTNLMGVREIASDVELSGTRERVMARASIIHTLLWKLASSRIPAELRAVASGTAPVRFEPVPASPPNHRVRPRESRAARVH